MTMKMFFLKDVGEYKAGYEGFIDRTLGKKLCSEKVAVPWCMKDRVSPAERKAIKKARAKAKAEEKAEARAKAKAKEKAEAEARAKEKADKAKELLEKRDEEKIKTTVSKKAWTRSKAVKK